MALCVLAAAPGLLLPNVGFIAQRSSSVRMAVVDEFVISKEIKEVRVFDGDYAAAICDEVAAVGKACIEEKGSFSLAIPGGSVVAALGGLAPDAFDFSKTHIFFCNEKIPSYPCIEGALEQTSKLGVPEDQVYAVAKEGTPAEVAAAYTELLKTHPSVDNSGPVPGFDMMLLGTGPDGHCGCLFPDSAEIKATGTGAAVLAGNDERADGDFIAVTMDVMCATSTVIVSAAGSGRAPMVAQALSGDFGLYDCPAGMVEGRDATLWFTDSEGVAEFDEGQAEEAEEEEEEPEDTVTSWYDSGLRL